jgi:predicted deacylase
MHMPTLRTVEDLSSLLDAEKLGYEVLAENFASQPILMVKKPGTRGKPVVITSGAHTSEPAGVLAVLQLIRETELTNPVYFVPLRDPFGWQGYARCLGYALGKAPRIATHQDVEHILTSRRAQTLHKEPGFIVSEIAGVVFVSLRLPERPVGPRQVEQRVNRLLRERPELVEQLTGKRLVFPANSGEAEGVRNFYRAFTAIVNPSGLVADMNRGFGGPEEVAEVRCLRALVDEVEPGLVLDLHEGQGSSFYFFVPGHAECGETRRLTGLAAASVTASGTRLLTLKELAEALGPRVRKSFAEPSPGVFTGSVEQTKRTGGSSFGAYCRKFCPSLTFESGRWAPLEQRVTLHLTAARAVLAACG